MLTKPGDTNNYLQMKRYHYPIIFFILLLLSCLKAKKFVTDYIPSPRITSPEYVDSLLFVPKNGCRILTSDSVSTFTSPDPHISITNNGVITYLTSAEVVPITITWKDLRIPSKTIYALGANDVNQVYPFKKYQGALATNAYAAYLQGWKTLQQLPVSGQTYAIVLRHADASCGVDFSVDHNYMGPPNWWESADTTLARQLNPQGVNRATQLGAIFKDLKYPIKRVITSEFYRSKQTATLMNLGITTVADGRINHPSYTLYAPGLYNGMVAILGEQPIDNQMTLIIAHHPINEVRAVTGHPSFPDVSPFNWTAAYLIKIETDGTLTYKGAASWAMFKLWRDLKLHKTN
jgi:phosphohistidine phosphatase SixA